MEGEGKAIELEMVVAEAERIVHYDVSRVGTGGFGDGAYIAVLLNFSSPSHMMAVWSELN